MNEPNPNAGAKPKPSPTASSTVRRLLLGAAFAATFVAGGLVASGAPAMAFEMAMDSAAMGDHGGMHGMHGMGQAHLEHMLTEVGANADQKAKIHAIMKTAFEAMKPLHEKMEETHRQLHQLLAAPTIDRAALEQLRAARIADFDQASKTMVQAMADAAEVLTPEQRAKLAGLMAEHHHHHDQAPSAPKP